tara:strand:+ start:1370 stop:1801 length:432 start_codon:yes stop_codon:yes gene_type:complete
MIKIFSCLFGLLLFSSPAFAQKVEPQKPKGKRIAIPIRTFKAKVKVVGVLQGTKDLAVIQVMEVDSNKYNLSVGDEVLCKFYFGTKPFVGEEKYPGVKGGEIIEAQIHARPNKNNVQTDYRILQYKVLGFFDKKAPPLPSETK